MRKRLPVQLLLRASPGIAGLCVLLLGVNDALAAARVPYLCRPEIRCNEPTGHYLLYSANCPSQIKCLEGEVEHPCDNIVVASGPRTGWKGCACPTVEAEHSCILIYNKTDDKEGVGQQEYYIVDTPDCLDLCDDVCSLTAMGGSSPWVVYCTPCTD